MTLKNEQFVFVDFFDTIIFRHVTVKQAVHQWAVCLSRKYPCLEDVSALVRMRREAFARVRETIAEPTFLQAMASLYDALPQLKSVTSREEFAENSEQIEMAVEFGCQYPNRRLVARLSDMKRQGCKIICVSDFYLTAECLKRFLENCNISADLFDGMFVSCECGRSKARGDLYGYVMEKLGITDPASVTMIGDNPRSDRENALRAGLKSRMERHIPRKAVTKLRAKLFPHYSSRQMKDTARYCYRHGVPFSEYIVAFYVFTRKLVEALQRDGVKNAAFMAREGYYLRDLFELYQQLCVSEEKRIASSYFRCSRRSIYAGVSDAVRRDETVEPISLNNWLKAIDLTYEDVKPYIQASQEELERVLPLEENPCYVRLMGNPEFAARYDALIEQNRRAFQTYLEGFLDHGRLNVVDSGWKGTTQAALLRYYGVPSTGYYIGTQAFPDFPAEISRHGLLFEEPDGGDYDFVGMNFPFYQELLAAPHGSAISYTVTDAGVVVKEQWDETEKALYEKRIEGLQRQMTTRFMGLCAWCDGSAREDWTMAKAIFHSNMFAYGERLAFARDCEGSFLINFQQEKKGAKQYDYKEVPLKPDLFIRPEKYIRYVTKIQRSGLYKKKFVRLAYPPFARCFYGYTLLLHAIKGGK